MDATAELTDMLRRATICLFAALSLVGCKPDPLPDGEQPPPDYPEPDYPEDGESAAADDTMHRGGTYAA